MVFGSCGFIYEAYTTAMLSSKLSGFLAVINLEFSCWGFDCFLGLGGNPDVCVRMCV